jgi:hypothetical protein
LPIANGGTNSATATGSAAQLQYLSSLTGGVARTYQTKFGDIASVKDFGAKGDGSTDDTSALAAAQSWLAGAAQPAALFFPQGKYVYSSSPNWSVPNASIIGLGQVTLQYTGTGNAFIVDAGSLVAQQTFNMTVGPFIINAPSTALNGVYIRSIHHSTFEFNVRGAGSTSAAMYIQFAVCNIFNKFTCSNNETFYSTYPPQYGILLDKRNAGELVSYCQFIDPIIEGITSQTGTGNAIDLEFAIGNCFYGGTAEGGFTGVYINSGSLLNKFYGMDLESNSNIDIYCNGSGNEFYGVDSTFLVKFDTSAAQNKYFGGSVQSLICAAGSTQNVFSGMTYNRNYPNTNTGTITDSGTYNSFFTCANPAKSYLGKAPTRTVVTVGASPYTYTNTSGDIIELLISGGVSVSLVYSPKGGVGDLTTYTAGSLYTLRSGDQLIITYTGAPTVISYS